MKHFVLVFAIVILAAVSSTAYASPAGDPAAANAQFPRSLESYDDGHLQGTLEVLQHRIGADPFNLVATVVFLLAIIHTFMASKISTTSHRLQHEHQEKILEGEAKEGSVDMKAELLHFLGEVEVIFGLWLIPLVLAIVYFHGSSSAIHYFKDSVDFTEPAFVVVIMVLAATRPILRLAESLMVRVAAIFGGTLAVLWFVILTLGPLLGSFITEPAAMTICAMLLSQKFYELKPSNTLRYGTLALLFVNISVGGVLTHFAAPPVLMVAGAWDWGTLFMLENFGWKAIIGILLGNAVYFLYFRKELNALQQKFAVRELKDEIEKRYLTRDTIKSAWEQAEAEIGSEQLAKDIQALTAPFSESIHEKVKSMDFSELEALGYDEEIIHQALDRRLKEAELYRRRKYIPFLIPENERADFIDPEWDRRDDKVPVWITIVHILFMLWTIANAHYQDLFILGFLFFIGFAQVTSQYQNRIQLRPAMLVGFFLAGLVAHGGLQAWWIAPVLGSLSEGTLMFGATVLTAFNDNAAITYLSTLVPGFTDSLKYAVVAGAVAGGGLTIIANAPNPAGQALLKQHFNGSVAPAKLLVGALIPTTIVWLSFALL